MNQRDRRDEQDWLRLHPDDNVACLLRSVRRGERVRVGEDEFVLESDIGLGHKIALRDIAVGEKIMKFGFPIGSATDAIARGAHVHLHNMKSDYLPTYILDGRAPNER